MVGGLDCFCTFVAGSPGEHPRDLYSAAAIFQSWKRVPFPSAKGLGMLVNTFKMATEKTANDFHISLVFCSF